MRGRRSDPIGIGRVATLILMLAGVGLGSFALASRFASTPPPAPAPAVTHPADPARIDFAPGRYPTLPLPDSTRRTVRSLLKVDRRMRFGDYVWNDRNVPAGPVWVRVDLAAQTISVFRAEREIGTAVILYGTDDKPTPTGAFPILERAEWHRSTLYDADMPYMLRLTRDGVAIHASSVREGSATHGCIGVPFGFAQMLFAQVRRGDLVVILPSADGGNRSASG